VQTNARIAALGLVPIAEESFGMDTVSARADPIELLLAVRTNAVDAVVLGIESDDERGILSQLLAEYPDLTVLAVPSSGNAFIEQRCPCRWRIEDTSARGLLCALRSAVMDPCDSGGDMDPAGAALRHQRAVDDDGD
jgi:hypothetical protein